ncbi:helix-turn-helix transcriptional regulator [Streptomonospora nanhaiensis]|uniref:Proteasome accessory factor B/proteasome accessory factor C n=3 Tax=Streptomonospora nanhaiensis TaxID=1323731 RepID=A0A853BIY2_9ACTN|nr:WYL domain-containing protein [Streptomonospora nanhaiensis]MBV2365000.1 WYL domain-containing protein [Streptomonospora nanhaiensis]NYI94542.1 proteasome accessory factor B/proteasome accessory factor C [Streptomonospora nanhaiensis]
MSRRKTERQLNLVICLLATRRFLTAREIRTMVAGYEEADSDSAFKRMFERDKRELRESGIPIETGGSDPWTDDEGYRIFPADYELPEIELMPDEAAVLGLAARAWRHAALGDAAANALMKLRAAGVPVDTDAAPALTPVLGTDEPAFLPMWQAVRDRRRVAFAYRKPGEPVARRRLEPWGVVNYRGHWYVGGHDLDRGARRVFRLGRIVGEVEVDTAGPPVEVPAGVDVRSLVRGRDPLEPQGVARVRVRADSGHELRRAAQRIVPGPHQGDDPRWDLIDLPYADLDDLVGMVARFGDRAVIEAPAEARAAIAAHLADLAARDPGPEPGDPAAEPEPAADARRGSASAEQLRRLLMLVPYALSHDVRVHEVAEHFGLSQRQVLKDLSLLWMCGLPGYTPGDLIDVDIEAAESTGEIIIANAETLAQPLRLTADEAASLIIGLELLAELPGVADSDALKRVGEKLRAAAAAPAGAARALAAVGAGGAARPGGVEPGPDPVHRLADAVGVRIELSDEVREVQRRCDEALRAGQLVHLRYLSGYVDEVTERDVDPMGLVVYGGHAFLEGWCRLRGDVRLFRLDRVLDLTVLPEPARVPARARRRDLRAGVLRLSDDDTRVTLDLDPSARWVAEEYHCSSVRDLEGGGVRATLRTPAPEWVRRLALRLGPRARVVAPVELAEQVRERARAALAAYGPDPSGT